MDSERIRLGHRKFLVLLTQKIYDIDGLIDYVFLPESFDEISDAIAYVDSSSKTLYARQIAGPDEYRKNWHLESEGVIPFLTAPDSEHWANPIRVFYDRTYKLRAGPYDTKYCCYRVIGPFDGDIVSDGLFSFVNERSELWSYFVDVGDAIKKGIAPRQPN